MAYFVQENWIIILKSYQNKKLEQNLSHIITKLHILNESIIELATICLWDKIPSWHRDVVTTLSQRRCWRCHNVVARSKMRVVPTSVSNVVTTSFSDVIKMLPQRCCNVATLLSIGFLGHFTTDYSHFFPFNETWESYKSAKWH